MELILLDDKFNVISAPIDRYYSLQWFENYYDAGGFELHLASDFFPAVLRSEYVYNNEADEAMLIDDVQASDDGKQTLKLSGKSLDTLLKHRVMDQVDSFTGTVEDIARQAVQKYAIASDRSVSLLRLGTRKGYTDTAVATNERGAELYEWLRELLKPYEMSFRIHYNFEDNALDFEVYRGLDRTQEQTTNTWAIFSTSFENLSQFSYARNRSDYRNYAIVMTDDGTKRVTVDKTGGAPRRELFVSADDELDTAAMTQLGESALAEYAMIETVSGEVQGGANLVYGENYALGDLCNIEDTHLGVSAAARLTQMTTVVEKGVTRRVPSFGEQYLSLRQYVAREVRASGGGGGSSGGGVVDLTEIEQAIAANAAAIEAANDEIEAVQAAAYDNAADINSLTDRVETLEQNGGGSGGGNDGGLPENYIPLNYIGSNGTQYIDTLFKPNQNTRVIIEFYSDNTKTAGIFGVRNSSNQQAFLLFANGLGTNFQDDFGSQSITTMSSPVGDYRVDKNKNSTSINGTVLTHSNVSFTSSYNLFLFAINRAGSVMSSYIGNTKIYSCRIYDNGVLIRNYVPCETLTGEKGLYDLKNHKFYGNAGTGSFTGG